jgi:putative membrane protein
MIRNIKGFLYGFIFGIGSPVPGISAGSMAVLLNVYDRFFNTISISTIKKNLLYTVLFLSGWAFGLLSVSSFIMFLFENHNQIISFCFIGLVAGCIPLIFKKARKDKTKIVHVSVFTIALTFMIFLAFFGGELSTNSSLEQLGGITPGLLVWIFIASFISSTAMLIPGVGGSLMMLVFGIYTLYVESIAMLNWILIAVFAVSMVLGVLVGIYFTKKMLLHYSQTLYYAILGFIIGSLFIIYPGFTWGIEGILSCVLMVAFAFFAYWLSKKG